MNQYTIAIIVIVGLAIFLGVINSANTILHDLFKKHSQTQPVSQANTVGFLYYIKEALNLDIDIRRIKGKLTDCYIPKYKVITLSDDTYNQSSISALAVTAHEVGHAIQHKNKPAIFNFVRFLNGFSKVFSFLIIPALIFSGVAILLDLAVKVGFIVLYAALTVLACGFLYKLFTIPLEFDASRIGLNLLKDFQILNQEELKIANKITNAAAFTYIADFIRDILGLNLFRRR